MFILLGPTNTDKSTLFNLIQIAFDNTNIINSVSPDIFIKNNNSNIKSCYKNLEKGLNCGFCSEFKNTQSINSKNIKELTGMDKSFNNITKLFIFTNYMPTFNNVDEALLDRLLFIPFNYDFKKYSSENDTTRN